MSIRNMLKNILRGFGLDCGADSVEVTGTMDITGTLKLAGDAVTATAEELNIVAATLAQLSAIGSLIQKYVSITQKGGDGTYTANITIPAGMTVVEVGFYSDVLWNGEEGDVADLNVGDITNVSGYFDSVDLLSHQGLNRWSEESEVGAFGSAPKDYANGGVISFVVTQEGDGTAGRTVGYVRCVPTATLTAATKEE